jgi:hypothetical protein
MHPPAIQFSRELAPIDDKGRPVVPVSLAGQEYQLTPDRAPAGPVTVIVSKTDQRVVVLRNGIEMGRSVAHIADEDPSSHVVTLSTDPNGRPRWIYLGLPGHDADAGRELDEATINRLRLPRVFHDAVKAILVPGSTILITASSVGDDGRGRRLTIMDAVVPQP